MASGAPSRSGLFVGIIGPSGAGKDSLLNYAREQLAADPRFVFVRRIVTRSPDTDLEDHDSMTSDAFEQALRDGHFALSWEAHGLSYGLPGDIQVDIAAGRVVIANISRKSVDAARAQFKHCRIISVTAPRDVLAKRLAGRGRESAADVEARLSRNAVSVSGDDVSELDNAGALTDAGDALLRLLLGFQENSAASARD